jgi:glyoxylase-like metal-dependent hydrolase (beta-lactamase superfamily II)
MEDDFTYVIRKALRGLSLAPGDAASRAGLPESEVMGLIRGRFSADAARRLAPVLSLNAEALSRLPDYEPKPMDLPVVERLDIPFEDGQVNAWLVRADGLTFLFDAGFSDTSITRALDAAGAFKLDATFITHDHRDHVGGLDEVRRRGPLRTMLAGDSVTLGSLTIHAFDLTGHCDGALGFRIEGLAKPVCVVGDALFAGSIGGCPPETYQPALAHLRRGVFTLPDETVLLPGHGPATTVGEEGISNPFFP